MVIGAVLAGFVGTLCALLTVLPFLPGSELAIDGRPVTPAYYMSRAAPVALLATVLLFAIVWGVWRERAWVRVVVLVVWALYTTGAVLVARSGGDALYGLVVGVTLLVWSAWYFFVNPRVLRYYAALPTRGAGAVQAEARATSRGG